MHTRNPTYDLSDASRYTRPEYTFTALGSTAFIGMLWGEAGAASILISLVVLLGYSLAVKCTLPDSPGRIICNFCAAASFYTASGMVVDKMGRASYHKLLLKMDRLVFTESPSVMAQFSSPWWASDLLCLGYLSYHVYLIWVVVWLLFQTRNVRRVYNQILFTAFGLGLFRYILLPSSGMSTAFPELFHRPISGGSVTQLTLALVDTFAARYDTFPSLHVLITSVMLACDWQQCRVRFKVMLVPSIVMLAATILLRFHFAIDLIASMLIVSLYLPCVSRRYQGTDA